MNQKTSSILPSLIRRILQEHRRYHHIFSFISGVAACFSFVVLLVAINAFMGQNIGFQLALVLILFFFFALCSYFAFYHYKWTKLLDNTLDKGDFSVIKGQLEHIQSLPRKRVRYIIDGQVFESTLIIPGFGTFRGIQFKEVVAKTNEAIELYLLPNGKIAGAIYPNQDQCMKDRQATAEDWRIVSRRQWKGVGEFALLAGIILLIILGTLGLVEYQEGSASWEMFGYMCVIFGSTILLLFTIYLLMNLSQIQALRNKRDASVTVQVFRGTAAEWYLTEVRHRSAATQEGWIRLSGGLHHIQSNVSALNNTFLHSVETPMQVEYLIFKDRLIFLRSTKEENGFSNPKV